MQLQNPMQHNTLGYQNKLCLPSLDSGFLGADLIVRIPGHRIWNQQIVSLQSRPSVFSGSDLLHIMALGLICSKGNTSDGDSNTRWYGANLNNAGMGMMLDF